MTNTELYINGVLVDTGKDLGVRLNRQLLNPGELNTKDAQYSYSISLPPTPTNHAAFNYAHVEETKNKFNREYRADLIINSVRIFRGAFRLSNIDRTGYKGNLYLPAQKTVKDIFGELKLNQNPEYRIPFSDFAASINQYNTQAANGAQIAIFPYTLYGVLPKVPLNKNENNYSARTLWDASVRLGIQDLAPSINPLLMLRHIFQGQGYTLTGSAFDDQKLLNLYMSYKNASDYVQPWNYGYHAKISLAGTWSSRYNARNGMAPQFERGVNQGSDPTGGVYACDLLDATNTDLQILNDPGANVLATPVNDADGVEWIRGQIRIPSSGFYKIKFGGSLHVYNTENWRATDPSTGVQHVGGYSDDSGNDIRYNLYELRLCRDRNGADFGLSGPKLNNQFYYDNQPQNETFDAENIPKYFPQMGPDGQINFVDLAQDPQHVLGFAFGRSGEPGRDAGKISSQYINPLDTNGNLSAILAAKPAVSWRASDNTTEPTRLAIKSPGYMKYGRIGNFDNEGDNPDSNIDYSAGPFVTGQVLDGQGNPVAPAAGNLDYRNPDYYVNRAGGYLSALAGWETSDYIDLRQWSGLAFSTTVTDNPDASILSFYDENFQFIGSAIEGPAVGNTDAYTDEPITAPSSLAIYARVSGQAITITGTNVLSGNKILNRFGIQRYFTYRLETDITDGYQGFAYIHNGAAVEPLAIVAFVDGIAEFSTAYSQITTPLDLKLTIYLTTPSFDVDGTLVISRRIQEDSEDVIDWEATSKYKIDLDNAPANFAKRGQYDGGTGLSTQWYAQGQASAVVWLNAGELLTVASVSSEGRYRRSGMHSTYGWVNHEVKFTLDIEPFRIDADWLKVSLVGNGTAHMDWNDPVNFDTDSINLVGFLSADIKTDDFIDNLCKAFNLRLSQTGATTFSLDVKQSKTSVSNRFIDLDGLASVTDRVNTPLGLPSLYKIGFTIDTDEEGYKETGDNGGGQFETGVTDGDVVEQKSFFSFNWLKDITKVETGGNVTIPLALISKSDAWDDSVSYPDAMEKRYTDQAYRFWYYDGLLNDLGATFQFNNHALQIAKVANERPGFSILNYKNRQYTILDNYFTLLINGASHYTEVEGFITPLHYEALDGSIMAMFNGDLYYIAELSAYDPEGRNKTKIKLIRKI